MGSKGNYCGRSDYGPGKKGGFVADYAKGDKGIPPGKKTNGGQSTTKGGVESNYNAGDKGIPPMNAKPSGKAPLD